MRRRVVNVPLSAAVEDVLSNVAHPVGEEPDSKGQSNAEHDSRAVDPPNAHHAARWGRSGRCTTIRPTDVLMSRFIGRRIFRGRVTFADAGACEAPFYLDA